MIVLLLVAWAVVLLPSIKSPTIGSSPINGVREFEETIRVLASTRAQGQPPGRWVMVPERTGGAARRRNRIVRRRRQNFERLLIASGVALLLGLIPPLRPLLIAHLFVDVVLVVYVVQLRRWALHEREREQKVRQMPASERRRASAVAESG